jgi:general secretion pathway protein H
VTRNGFTLVELMVAIALMALAAGVVVLTVAAPGKDPRDAAVKFATRLAAARDRAILTGQPISAWIAPSGYGFDQYRSGRWQQLEEKPFDGADWPEGIIVTSAGESGGRARVRFDNLGMPDNPATIRLDRDGAVAEVVLVANGDVRVK